MEGDAEYFRAEPEQWPNLPFFELGKTNAKGKIMEEPNPLVSFLNICLESF